MAKYSWIYDKPNQQGNLTNPPPNSANIPVEEHQPSTPANHMGFEDIRGSHTIPLRRPTVVCEEAKMTDASPGFLQEDVAATTPILPLRRPAK